MSDGGPLLSSSGRHQIASRGRRAGELDRVVSLLAVLVIAPVTALIVARAPVEISLIAAAAFALLLVVLWSAEATFYVLIFSMLLSPEFIVGELAGGGGDRGITLRFDDYVIAMIVLAWLVRLAVFKDVGLFRGSPLTRPIFTYLGVAAVATAVGVLVGRVQPLPGFFYVAKYFEYVVIFFLVINYVRDTDTVKRLFYAAVVTAALISLIAILQIPGGQRVSAPFEGAEAEPNTLGGYLVLMIAIGLSFFADARSVPQRVLWGGFAALLVLPLVYTYSRTSWLAFAAVMVAVTLFHRRKTTFLVIGTLGLIVLLVSPPQAVVERASYTLAERASTGSMVVAGYTIEPSAAARLQSWFLAGDVLSQRPFLGFGVAGFGIIDAQFPRVLIETGLLGALAFLWLLRSLYGVGRKLQQTARDRFEQSLATGFLVGFLGMVAHGIGANTFIIVRIMEPFWLLAGLVVALLLIHESSRPRTDATPAAAGIA